MRGNSIILLLTGDIMLGGEFVNFKAEHNIDYEYPFQSVKGLFEKSDIIFGNLECTLSNDGIPRRDKAMALYTPPESVSGLRYLGYNVISLANNHINDYGAKGLEGTIRILEANNIPCFGAGKNLEEANRELIIERERIRVSFLGYTTDEKHVKSIIASINTAGCVFYDFSKIAGDIDRVRNRADIICISLHWGYDCPYPSPEQVELAHQIIDHGANIIIGHHPHIIQGYERYKHGIIFYSLGNFFFPDYYNKDGTRHTWPRKNNAAIIARCQISKGEVEQVEILPCLKEDDYRVVLLDGEPKDEVISYVAGISLGLGDDDYDKTWATYRKTKLQENMHTLFKRITDLGLRGSIKRISLKTILNVILILVKFVVSRFRWRIT